MIRAIPLTEEEVLQLGIEKHTVEVPYAVGRHCPDQRRASYVLYRYVWMQLDVDNNSVRVVVSMFGRETPVELELDQVELVQE